MGFRTGAYAKIWEVQPKSETLVSARVSISRKNTKTGEYEDDFSGFISFVGTACAKKAAGLNKDDRIKLGDVDVSRTYDKVKNTNYINFKVFSFDPADSAGKPAQAAVPDVDSGEVEEPELPF